MRARLTRGRDLNGVLLLDKPAGCSSNAAIQDARRLFQARKAGHTGSLDPLATGLLPVCFGEATKLSGFLLDTDKRYRFVAQLGARTTTGDAEGEIIDRAPIPPLTVSGMEAVLARFRGAVTQIPPMASALKHQGRRLYDLARQGVEVPRAQRAIFIHDLKLVEMDAMSLTLDVHCSKGTYVRVLAEDIGTLLGCGAYVTLLRRVGVGPFRIDQAHTLPQLGTLPKSAMDAALLPPESLLDSLARVTLNASQAKRICMGQTLPHTELEVLTQGPVGLFDEYGALLGVGNAHEDGTVSPRRMFRTQAGSSHPDLSESP